MPCVTPRPRIFLRRVGHGGTHRRKQGKSSVGKGRLHMVVQLEGWTLLGLRHPFVPQNWPDGQQDTELVQYEREASRNVGWWERDRHHVRSRNVKTD